ncbi:hypothetical protein [uncultured Comamonas sp.]|uniref:hypothetical protein n=1 Tax=uncultured Comamonas sp. TaxID=114710 RepID=UPI0025FCC79E|nr:hypothetical protein [uncultured Comamonas sp.]
MARNHKPADPRGGHVRIYWEIIDSMAWRAVMPRTQSLYVLMRRRLTSNSNGNISATLGEMKAHGWNASATLSKALRELQAVGRAASPSADRFAPFTASLTSRCTNGQSWGSPP